MCGHAVDILLGRTFLVYPAKPLPIFSGSEHGDYNIMEGATYRLMIVVLLLLSSLQMDKVWRGCIEHSYQAATS